MLESVLNNPNITEESIKTMAQHERCAQRSPGLHTWRSCPTRAPEEACRCAGAAAGMPLICRCESLSLHRLIRRLTSGWCHETHGLMQRMRSMAQQLQKGTRGALHYAGKRFKTGLQWLMR